MILYTLSIIGPLQLLFGAGTFLFLTGQHTKISTRWHHELRFPFFFSYGPISEAFCGPTVE